MWIQRGFVPGMSVGTQGVQRQFDLDTTLHIAIMGALGRLGYAAAFTSMAASEAIAKGVDQPSAKMVIGPARRTASGFSLTPTVDHVIARTEEEMDNFLDGFAGGRPEAWTTLELDKLAARVRKAFYEPDMTERARRQRGVPERRSVRQAMREDDRLMRIDR